jgi:hypothetical protein
MRHALGRLPRFRIVILALDGLQIGISGLAPTMSANRVEQLDALSRAEHDRLDATVEDYSRGDRGCSSQVADRLRRFG